MSWYLIDTDRRRKPLFVTYTLSTVNFSLLHILTCYEVGVSNPTQANTSTTEPHFPSTDTKIWYHAMHVFILTRRRQRSGGISCIAIKAKQPENCALWKYFEEEVQRLHTKEESFYSSFNRESKDGWQQYRRVWSLRCCELHVYKEAGNWE